MVSITRMERLVQAVCELASVAAIDDIVEIVRHAARELADADGATFVLREHGQCFYVDEHAIAPLWRGRRFPMDSCISGWAMLHRQAVAIRDIYLDDRIPHDAYRPTFVRSLAMTPIRTAAPIGAIGVYWSDLHDTTPEEERLLQVLADSTAIAMENVRVRGDLETRVAQRTALLADSNAALERFAAVAAHDLRGPLGTINGYAQLLALELSDAESTVRTAVDAIERASARLGDLVKDLLALARTGVAPPAVATVNLDDTVATVLDELQTLINERGGRAEYTELGNVCADPSLLHQALQNLIANAFTHVGDDVQPHVRIETLRTEDTVTVKVSDNGPGVPIEERARILEPFARGAAAASQPGTGLGLAICNRIATQHGGRLVIGDASTGGAEFALVLPAEQPVIPAGAIPAQHRTGSAAS